MVLGQYISQILETFNIYSDDSTIEVEWLKDLINNQREFWLKREYSKAKVPLDDIISDLGCLKMELVDEAECCEINAGCAIIRSVKEIPRLMPLKNFNGLYRVGSGKKFTGKPYTIINMIRTPYIGKRWYNKNEIFTFQKDQRIYLISGNKDVNMVEYINAWGVVSDPTALATFIDCNDAPCYTDDSKYPMPVYLWPMMKEAIIKEVSIKLGIPYDLDNDNREDVDTSPSAPEATQQPAKSK